MSLEFNYTDSSLAYGLNRMTEKMGAMLLMYSATKAAKIESKMKMNRPWTDRTGAAKARLSAKVSTPNASTIRITLAHGVSYGIYLELAHEKNFAIIQPTVKEEAPLFVKDLQGILEKIDLKRN